jgi:hypothetical protein
VPGRGRNASCCSPSGSSTSCASPSASRVAPATRGEASVQGGRGSKVAVRVPRRAPTDNATSPWGLRTTTAAGSAASGTPKAALKESRRRVCPSKTSVSPSWPLRTSSGASSSEARTLSRGNSTRCPGRSSSAWVATSRNSMPATDQGTRKVSRVKAPGSVSSVISPPKETTVSRIRSIPIPRPAVWVMARAVLTPPCMRVCSRASWSIP